MDAQLAAWGYIAMVAASGYLLGSIPFGLVVTRMAGLGDIRSIGSGNIGATNVLRTGRKGLALATLILDAGKAALAFGIWWWFSHPDPQNALTSGPYEHARSMGLIAGAFAFVGHCYPVWLKFKGGKGVATFVGLLFAAMWQAGLAFALVWLAIAFVFRMSSLAALIAVLAPPVVAWFVNPNGDSPIVFSALAVLIYWRHRANIKRLLNNTEPRFSSKKKDAAPAPEPPA